MSDLRVVRRRDDKPPAAPVDERARRVFLAVRRALLAICAVIEKEYGTE